MNLIGLMGDQRFLKPPQKPYRKGNMSMSRIWVPLGGLAHKGWVSILWPKMNLLWP
jgi:hypothetical protein